MRVIILYVSLLVIASGCSSSKRAGKTDMLKDAPEWVQQTPNAPSYYHGIGMIYKSGVQNYRERARQVALSELAGNISVNISSSSVLNQFEYDHTYSEFFKDEIRMNTQEQLEGFEFVEQWENDQQYWVYYRLSKSTWEEIKKERRDKALRLSKAQLEQANSYTAKGNYVDALNFYICAIEEIRDFLGEDLRISFDNEERSYATSLKTAIINDLQRLKIVFPSSAMEIGPDSKNKNLSFEAAIIDNCERPVSGIPIITRFTWLPGYKIETTSDINGKFKIAIGTIDFRKQSEKIISEINLDKIVSDNTNDILVKRLFETMKPHSYILPIKLTAPAFDIVLNEKNIGQTIINSGLREEIVRLLKQNGFELVSANNKGDYSIIVEANTQKGSERNGLFSAKLNAAVLVKDRSNKTVYNRKVEDISGLGSGFSEAGRDAFRSFISKYRISIYPEIVQNLF